MVTYEESVDIFSGLLRKLDAGWVYSSEFPPPEGADIKTTPRGSQIWRKFTPRDKTPEEKTATAHPTTTVGNHVAESDLPRDSKILDFGAGRGTQSRRLQGIGEYAPHEKHSEHAPKEPFTNVHSYDTQPPYDDESKLKDKYDAVMASNVLNVQADDKSLTSTLDQLQELLNDKGHIIANFPSTPNKHPNITNPSEMQSRLEDHFGKDKVTPIKGRHWKISKEDNMNSYKELQNFYKENYEIDKAMKVDDPWALARSIVDGKMKNFKSLKWDEHVDPNAPEEEKRSMMGRIVAGIEQNKWNKMLKSEDIQKKMSPAMGALAGWWLGGEIQEIIQGHGQPTPAQQREFERQIQRQMRRGIRKETTSLEALQTFYSDANDTYIRRKPVQNGVDVQKASYIASSGGGHHLSAPPREGETYNLVTHRWEKPENHTKLKQSQGGKARLDRASGTGTMERSVGGHGKGLQREEQKGRKNVTHDERLKPGFDSSEAKKQRREHDASSKKGKHGKKTHSRNSSK